MNMALQQKTNLIQNSQNLNTEDLIKQGLKVVTKELNQKVKNVVENILKKM